MLPEFIPYIVKRVSYVDSTTGKSHGWSYEKKYRLYHVPSKKLIKFIPIERIHYVDGSLTQSTSLVLECKNKAGQDKYTIINSIEDLESPLWFDYLKVITHQLILVRKDKKWGVINDRLQMKCFFEFDSMEEFISTQFDKVFIIAKKDEKYGLLNEDLSIRFNFLYDSIECNWKLGIFVLQTQSSITVFDVEDSSISKFPFIANSIKSINEGCMIVERNSKYCVYDKDAQKFLTDIWFDDIDRFQNGFCLCDHRYILERNGSLIDLGEGQRFVRSGEIVYSTTHIQGDDWLVKVYKREKYLYEFTHTKGRYGIFYCRVIEDRYVEVGNFSDKYSHHNPEALYDMDGQSVTLSMVRKNDTSRTEVYRLSNKYHARGFRVQPSKRHEVENVEEFERLHFNKSKYLTGSDSYDLIELESNLLRLETMSVDCDGSCDWSLVGYIYNDMNMWVDVNITND